MNPILDFGIQINLAMQGLGTGLKTFMEFLSFLGTELFYLLLIPAIYWCWNTTLGIRIGLLLTISTCLNSALKLLFHQPRPYWYDIHVQGMAEETSFGIPSGHAQNAVVVWGGLAAWISRGWAWILTIVLIFLIGLSRIYLGVHFPTDVLVGWLIGMVILAIYLKLEIPVKNWLKPMSASNQILIAFLFSLLLILLPYLSRVIINEFTVPEVWIENARQVFPESEPINPLSITSVFSSMGVLFGLSFGTVMLSRRGGMNPGGFWWKRVLRYLVGIAGVLVIYLGLSQILPGGDDLIGNLFRYIRYGLVSVWISWLAPLLFFAIKLAEPNK